MEKSEPRILSNESPFEEKPEESSLDWRRANKRPISKTAHLAISPENQDLIGKRQTRASRESKTA
jgi:hypothetical protein